MFHLHLNAPSLEHLERTRSIRLRASRFRLILDHRRFQCLVSEPCLSRNLHTLLLSLLVYLNKSVSNRVRLSKYRTH
jgi:hypothetical protein